MKIISAQRLGLLTIMFLLFCSAALYAQDQKGVVVIKRVVYEDKEDGSEPVKNVTIIRTSSDSKDISWDQGHFEWNTTSLHRDPCKVFIGVGTSVVDQGLKVDYTVDETPARTYGVQPGDIITALDGIRVGTHNELIAERDKHQQGEAFRLTILRDGREMNIDARFRECTEAEQEQAQQMRLERLEEMKVRMENMQKHMEEIAFVKGGERPILGVYENEDINVQGMAIRSVIQGKGAEAAGMKAGDIVIGVNGTTVTGAGTLRNALAEFKPGDNVNVIYVRDGKTIKTNLVLSAGNGIVNFTVERDPCAVFIGVYTTEHSVGENRQGVRVTGIVDDTPAKQSGVQPGDIIMELDGQPVTSSTSLRFERDKHQPGESFSLSILRDGQPMTIEATFKSCPKTEVAPLNEVVEVDPEETQVDPRQTNQLQIESLMAYPNPTTGPVNVRFEAEAVPTTVRMLDITGKAVYQKVLNNFNGLFSEQINLFGNKPGTFILQVQQGEKVFSRRIVLMAGA
ncbi:MAG: PDZ domain-containing protein [Saprospiraceae bacterium]